MKAMTMLMADSAGAPSVEDLFSTDLYTGDASDRDIVNGIDLAGEGGMVWFKGRSQSTNHKLYDTERGVGNTLWSNLTNAEGSAPNDLTSFKDDGFSIGFGGDVNTDNQQYASWTFRKSPKFFDVVKYTGDGIAGREIAHNLGCDVGMVVIKSTSISNGFFTWHRGSPSVVGQLESATIWSVADFNESFNSTEPTDSVITLGSHSRTNGAGVEYVAYFFAHDDSDEGIIQCGSYTGNGAPDGPDIDLGWEPQYLMVKNTDRATPWYIADSARGLTAGAADRVLITDASNVEADTPQNGFAPTATGFNVEGSSTQYNAAGETIIYMAIRKPDEE